MEGTWHAKCNSSLPPSLPILQFPAMESRSQVRMGVGQYPHPSSVQHGCTNERASREGSMMFDTFNIGHKTGKPDNGNYFLALLAASPQQFQCEMPSSSVARLPMSTCTLPILESSVVCKASSSTVEGSNPMTWLPQPQGSECFRNEAEVLSVSLRDLPAVSRGRAMLLHDVAQTGNSPLHGFNPSRQAPHHAVFNYRTGSKESDPCFPGVTQTFSKLQQTWETTSHGFMKQALESQYSLPASASAYLRGYPRVFCLTTSGVLLISETGHLGIICLCHNLHMSVSNFCEHSGSSAADPGDSVRMESGETLGQWRRLYFPKLGIKMRDENSGWDWPDWNTGMSGSSELKASHLQNIAKDSCLRQDVGLFGRRGMASQPCSELISFTNPLSEQINFETFADCFGRDAQQRNAYGECDVVKNPNDSSKGTVSKEAQEDGYQSVAECVGMIQKSGNSYSTNIPMESLKSFTNDSSGSRCVNPAQPSFLHSDAFSSNFELRLGQPSEQPQACNGSFVPLKSQALDLVIEPRVLQYDSMKHRAINTRLPAELQQSWQHPQQESLAKKETEKEGEVFPVTYGFRSGNADKVGDSTVRSSLMQVFYPQIGFRGNNEDDVLWEDTDRLVSSTEQLMAGILGADYPVDKCELGDPYKCKVLATGFSNQIGNGKSLAAGVNSSSNSLPVSSVHTMPFTDAKSHAVTGGNCAHVGSSSHVGQSSYVTGSLYSAYDLKSPGQVGLSSTIGIHDPSITPGPSLSSLSPVNFPVRNQICLSNFKSISQKEESIHPAQHKCDENSRLCALRNMVGMSVHDHEIANHDFSQDDGRLCCHTAIQMQRNEDKEDVTRMKLTHGSFLPGRETSEVSVRSLHTCNTHCLGGGCPCCLSGATSAWNLIMPHEIAFHSKEIDAPSRYCCCSHGHHEQCLLRLGKNAHGCTDNDEHACCNTTLSGKCGCFGRIRCLAGNCWSRLDISSGSFHEHNDHDHAAGRSSFLHGPLVDRRPYAPSGGTSQNIHHENLGGCDSLKFDCQSIHWRQIPGRPKVNSVTTSTDMPAEIVNTEGEVDHMLQNTYLRGSVKAPAESMLNEQQMSNVCSEGSAPAVTEFSISSGDNCTDGENATLKNSSIVDEESGIKKSISSSDATDTERVHETTSLFRKVHPVFPVFADIPSHKLAGKAKVTNSVRLKKLKNNGSIRPILHEPIVTGFKMQAKEKAYKVRQLDSSLDTSEPIRSDYDVPKCDGSFNHTDEPLQVDEQEVKPGCCFASGQSNHKRRRSMLSCTTSINKRSEACIEHQNGHLFDTLQREEGIKGGVPKVLSRKKSTCNESKTLHDNGLVQGVAVSCVHHEKVNKWINCGFSQHPSVCQEKHLMHRKQRPTVTGNSGIITNGSLSEGLPKPLKFGSLSLILKTAKRCPTAVDDPSKFSALSKTRKACNEESNGCSEKPSTWTSEDNEVPLQSLTIDDNQSISVLNGEQDARMVRKRSLCELTGKDKESNEPNKRISHANLRVDAGASFGVSYKKDKKWVYQSALRSSDELCVNSEGDIQQHVDGTFQQNHKRAPKPLKRKKSVLDDGTVCCVCRNNEMDDCNRLLQCESCLIKVHQGCYGVLKLPKGRWLCRPCREGSKNIVCVLCGYQGGAMTRALKSQKIIRSLLQAWKVGKRLKPVTVVSLSDVKDEVDMPNCTSTAEGQGKRECSLNEIMKAGMKSLDAGKWMNLLHPSKNHGISSILSSNMLSRNGLVDSLLNSAVKQWVHMVCGLWMPGTRCPNVDTMSAFDVSGVACAKKNKVCSMCRRSGGSCIKCRVDGCTMMFHPWCAHQKGLLQSEVEGKHNESIGFYGKCVLHSRDRCQPACVNPADVSLESDKATSETDKFTCARTEGYKGRKKEEGLKPNSMQGCSRDGSGCLVPQEQVNAWLHINGQKSCAKLPAKSFLASDVEYDSRKEYGRYKQAKGWKNLVVYKSGIHALGLYTSQFIPRGAMVVEYVGEIVGSHVADKREIEYLSGRGVQYKSACYFFRIDKEHIIDATRKGGIARFVNHSCLPNCVAKIITIRNEKKVVFFAERDINPGEEITYDYHFNHEDEGKKIPCFCNSKNCRRYLN
ncbi:uncharacterized protein LOC116249658 isoform X3 [Nymphaea colorata]|uniref:uncharacterized protein LOC116249658 isoform X3 n=1 Tax=Nymphaea colorata TaxID=210225 RepID=UPI00129EE5B6|nr:uncharacterized protein LOC116249658 isoform X3 [Nymphaea colorata]